MDEWKEEWIVDVKDSLGHELDEWREENIVNVKGSSGHELDERREERIVNVKDSSGHESASIEEKDSIMNTWIGAAKKFLEYEPHFLEEIIYPVPFCLKNDKTVLFYHPKEISFGPRHFGKMDYHPKEFNFLPEDSKKVVVACGGLEPLKIEVALKFHRRMKDGGLISLVEKLKSKKMQIKIEKSYGVSYETEMSPDVLAWLLARDGCFVLEVLESFSEKDPPEAENGKKTVLQHILDRKNHHPLLNDIVKDMFKLENQLPLWVLEEIREGLGKLEDYWFESALKKLSPIEIGEEMRSREYKKHIHLLQLFGEYMVDSEKIKEENCHNQDDREAVPFDPTTPHEEKCLEKQATFIITGLLVMFAVLFFLFLSPVFIIWFLWLVLSLMWECYQNYMWGRADQEERYVPTIEELDKIGVEFKKLEHKGISHIRFDEKESTLHLPRFTVDDRSEVILRNLLVMETHWKDTEKKITRYVVFMNDLVNTSGDVSRLRQKGIIVNKLGSDDDVAQLWNSVTIPATDIPNYEPIDNASKGITDYRRKGLKILWAQFRRLHCSKPWLVASLLGGISLLLLTIVQVVCLFEECEKR